jgi:starvation-inducible DNA-binding protein
MSAFLGLSQEDIHASVEALSCVLSDTYFVYLKTQNFHWNVKGSKFHMLHLLFESQYQRLALNVDTLAERVQMLGKNAPGTFSDFKSKTVLCENTQTFNASEMIADLLQDHTIIIQKMRKHLVTLRENADEGTKDTLISCLKDHEKMSWFLRRHLDV